jgi:hypothetical protein
MSENVKKRPASDATTYHLDAFAVGGIAALTKAGYGPREIEECELVTKADGSPVPLSCIQKIVNKLKADETWRGQRKEGSGRQRSTSEAQDAEMVQYVLDNRGREKLTSKKVKRRLGASSDRLVRRRLAEVGIKWLRRRCKTLVPAVSVSMRLAWASWIKQCQDAFLKRWVYTDGCSFYLDKDSGDVENSQRASLGKFVYRMDDGSDSLYKDCVGPSSYKKAQGECVRVWGLLIKGQLYITILERGAKMNRWEYDWIIRNRFQTWLSKTSWPLLVQDGEKCLWCEEPLKAFEQIGVQVLDRHPPDSPDLNAIENAWAFLRARLDETIPGGDEVERRDAFIKRVRAAVAWINKHRKSAMASKARNQKARAQAVEDNDGHRTNQ